MLVASRKILYFVSQQ